MTEEDRGSLGTGLTKDEAEFMEQAQKENREFTEKKKDAIDPSVIAAIKAQVIEEMKDDRTRAMEESAIEREKQKSEYESYVAKMKASPEPWVDVTGWSEQQEGVKVELEWNDAFVDYLKGNGITGTDDENIVQKWVTLLLRDMADQMDGTNKEEGKEFE